MSLMAKSASPTVFPLTRMVDIMMRYKSIISLSRLSDAWWIRRETHHIKKVNKAIMMVANAVKAAELSDRNFNIELIFPTPNGRHNRRGAFRASCSWRDWPSCVFFNLYSVLFGVFSGLEKTKSLGDTAHLSQINYPFAVVWINVATKYHTR